jgi:hypothetical protein
MFHYTDDWSDAAIRRFIARVGEENLANVYRLRRADAYATAAVEPGIDFLLPLGDRVKKILEEKQAFSLKDHAVNGNDLIGMGIPPGKTIGIILGELLETVLDDPAQNTRETLLAIAERMKANRNLSDNAIQKGLPDLCNC